MRDEPFSANLISFAQASFEKEFLNAKENPMQQPVNRRHLINQLQALTESDFKDFVQQFYGRRHVPAMFLGPQEKVTSLVEWAESIRGPGLAQLNTDFREYLGAYASVFNPAQDTNHNSSHEESVLVSWNDDDWENLRDIQDRIPGFDFEETRKTHLLAIDSAQMRNGGFDNLIVIRSRRLFNASIIEHLKQVNEKQLLMRHLKELRKISGNSADKNWLDQKIAAM